MHHGTTLNEPWTRSGRQFHKPDVVDAGEAGVPLGQAGGADGQGNQEGRAGISSS